MAGDRNCCKCVTVSLVPVASLVLVLVFAAGIVTLPIVYVQLSHKDSFGLIFDAGSSHTTLYGYSWKVEDLKHRDGSKTGEIRINPKMIFNCPQEGGINSFASDPENVYKVLNCCINKSKLYSIQLPFDQSNIKDIPLYLGATAGMRVLNMENQTTANKIMTETNAVLHKSGYKFDDSQAAIITGETEALGGWTSINYAKHKLNPPKTTIGSLDLGGASAEIAFATTHNSPFLKQETLFGKKYSVYARSYLCYGEDEAYARLLASLIPTNWNKSTIVKNPCFPSGVNVSVNASNIITGCVNGEAAMKAFGFHLIPSLTLAANETITFQGTGNTKECNRTIQSVLNFTRCWSEGHCNHSDPFVAPQPNGSFIGFAGFYYTAALFNATYVDVTYNNSMGWSTFSEKVESYCNSRDKNMKATEAKNCFNGLFMVHLLKNGFGFTTSNTWNVKFKQIVDNVNISWTLGYMLKLSSTVPSDDSIEHQPYTPVDLVVGIIILTILCFVFTIFFFLTFYACRKALRTRSGYQHI